MSDVVKSTCPYCGVGCGLLVEADGSGNWSIRGDPEHPANLGRLCSKGTALGETLDAEGRLTQPMIHGQSADWDRSLDVVAQRFSEIIEAHGPDAVAFYVSGQLLTEDYYVANKLMKGFIGSANIDTNSRLCMASSVAGHKRAFGADTVPGCYEDFEEAELIVLTGSNTAWCHPVLYRRIVRAKEARPDLRVVVIDPRETATCDIADLHLPLRSGTDSTLFNGLLCRLQDQGRVDRTFVEAHTEGADEALQTARCYAPSTAVVAELCGLEQAAVETFYRWFVDTPKTVTLYSQGINQTSSGTDKVNAIINCHLLTGRIGKPGSGPFSITGQPNAMGGREVGALANQLACHMNLEDAAHRDLVGRFWQAPSLASRAGRKAVDLFRAIERGEIKALWVMATNPAVSLPDASQVRRALRQCEFLVVSDSSHNDTTGYANVLLPALAWGEKDGTVTNSERRISRQRSFLPGLEAARPDWWIVSQVARRLGHAGFDYASNHEIFTEYAALSGFENGGSRDFDISALEGLSARDYDELPSLQWPVTAQQRQGTPRMYSDGRFQTPTRRARFLPVTPRPPGGPLTERYPLVLNTGRTRDQWHTMTRTGKSPRLSGHDTEPFVELHPQDAVRFGIEAGELARVRSRWGEVVVRAKVLEQQLPGSLFIPMHWNDQFAACAGVGCLINPIVDPVSGQPEFKHTPVAIEPYRPLWHGFLLTRQAITVDWASYWSRARRDGLWHYELAGEQQAESWSELVRQRLTPNLADAQWAEMFDSAGGHYRGMHIVEDRLQHCLFIGPDHRLPKRDWLVQLFAREALTRQERQSLLAGSPGRGQEDAGRTICACFGVGENHIVKAIRERGLMTKEAIGEALQAGTNCGSCLSEISQLIIEQVAQE
ncbi:MAG: molybdopterin-dependent oxidoreductase [Gammaproteobacteria bacterium]|nr:molybdopterin-dependent oxidoreductase [Gammaproteobacteria bacterium]